MKYFQIVLVLVMMALTTPLFYVQATKEITRSQVNKGLVEASTKLKFQSSAITELALSPKTESSSTISNFLANTSSLDSTSTLSLSSITVEVSSSSEIISSSNIFSSSSITSSAKSESKTEIIDQRKDELTTKILKSIEDKRIADANKEELTRKILKKEEERKVEEAKIEAEKKAAEEKRVADAKKVEEDKKAEEARLEAEKKAAEEKRVADEKAKELAIKLAAEAPKKVTSTAAAGSFSEAIDIQCANYGCNSTQLKRIMMCESTGNPNAQNGIYTGLFQFHPQTFAANSARAGLSGASIYNGYDQVATAAYMFANGQAGQWECK